MRAKPGADDRARTAVHASGFTADPLPNLVGRDQTGHHDATVETIIGH